MKKLLSIVTLLGALSGAASAAPYYSAVPAGGDLTPYDMQPVYSIEGLYTTVDGDPDFDMYGFRVAFSMYSNGSDTVRHQFGLALAPQWGSLDVCWGGHTDSPDVLALPATIGYDLNIALCDSVLFYMGGKVGYTWVDIDTDWGDVRGGGFNWSVGAGFKFQCSQDVYVQAGYEFGRTYLKYGDFEGMPGSVIGAHTISVGVGCTF